MLLPFLPGQYDSLAVPLSMMAQLFGIVGLLLVPLGVVWIAYEYRSEGKRCLRLLRLSVLRSLIPPLSSAGAARYATPRP